MKPAARHRRRIFGLRDKGELRVGADADVVIYDPEAPGTIQASYLHAMAGYTPYEGWPVSGRVRDVFSPRAPAGARRRIHPSPGLGPLPEGIQLIHSGTILNWSTSTSP